MDDGVAVALLRHGMTAANEKGAYIGWTDVPLSEHGGEMVSSLRTQADLAETELVFSSDLSRCMETARILYPGFEVRPLEELREMHFGAAEGKTYEELKHLESYREWLRAPLSARLDGAESFEAFSNRVLSGFGKVKLQVLAFGAKDAAVVTHGGVIRYLLSTFSGVERSFFEWKIPFAGGYRLSWTGDGFRRGEKCTLLQEVPITENLLG